mgnify:CR=1 FL=1
MSLIKDSSIYLIGELSAKCVPFLLLPYLSRKLGVEGFGKLSYYQTFLPVARYFYVYGKRSLNLVVKTGYAYTLSIGGLGLLFCWLMQSEIMFYLVLSAIFQVFLSAQH